MQDEQMYQSMSRSISVILYASCDHLTACEVGEYGYDRCLAGPSLCGGQVAFLNRMPLF